MRIKRVNLSDVVGMNMTPMIDIVFQLIIFLMLATDFANAQLERVKLPTATVANPDSRPDPNRVMVNISHETPLDMSCAQLEYDHDKLIKTCKADEHWKIKVNGQELTQSQLRDILTAESNLDSDRPLMIRADGGAPYRFLALVLQTASESKLWRVELGARRPAE
jgi:biopolymer transport protein ExbD